MKKVLSLVLVLALVLGSFSMAFAADNNGGLSDIADSPNANAITVVNDLGIVTGYTDGTFKGLNNVTRAEFAAMIVRALAIPESALNGFTTTSFTDTEGYGWAVPYLAYCASKGIMTGYGDGTVRPGATITVNEAITMVCRALGYTAEAKELVGSWPANYIALAQSLELYDDMSAVGVINRENAAQLIFNALTEDLVYIDADGATQTVSGKRNMLALLAGKDATEKEIILTSTHAENALININEFVGAKVKAFFKNDTDIIAIEVLSTFLDGEFDGTDKFVVGDVEYKINSGITTTTAVTNGKTDSNTPYTITDEDEGVIAAKVSGKTIQEIYSFSTWINPEVFVYDDGDLDLEDCELRNISFKLDKNQDIDVNSFALLGVAKLTDIEEGDVVAVYTDKPADNSTGEITRVEVGQKTVEGKITKISGDNFYIDGVKYTTAAGFETITVDDLKLGNTGIAKLAYNGKIASWEDEDGTIGNYAIYLGYKEETGYSDDDDTVNAKLFTKDGKTITAEVKDGTVVSSKLQFDSVSFEKDTLVKYALDKNGKIKELIKSEDQITSTGGVAATINPRHTSIDGTTLSKNVVLFVKDGDDWTIGNIKNVDEDFAFLTANNSYITQNKEIVALAINTSDVYGGDSTYGVINTTAAAVDADGENVLHVEGFIGGKELAAFTGEGDDSNAYDDYVGDYGLVEITVDDDGIVTEITPVAINKLHKIVKNKTITKVNTTNNTIEIGNANYDVSDDVVIYVLNKDKDGYKIGKLSDLKGKNVNLYWTKKDDFDGFNFIVEFDSL